MNMAQWSDLPLVLTSDQAAAVLQLKRRTIANMLDRGVLRGVKIGKEWRVGRTELMRFVEADAVGQAKIHAEPAAPTSSEPLRASGEASDWDVLAQLIQECTVETGIPDLAHQHDHYLYGKPKTG